jgi:hypothetical protein
VIIVGVGAVLMGIIVVAQWLMPLQANGLIAQGRGPHHYRMEELRIIGQGQSRRRHAFSSDDDNVL